MKKHTTIIYLFCLVFALQACSHVQPTQKPVAVVLPAKDALGFTGRGAMAGMMMSGSMGAMGIAIGVAIDEGISKDLTASAKAGGFNAKQIISEYLGSFGQPVIWHEEATEAPVIRIKNLGFRAKGDGITPWVEVQFQQQEFSYTGLFSGGSDFDGTASNRADSMNANSDDVTKEPPVYDLSLLCEDNDLAAKSLKDALILTLDASLVAVE